MHHAPLIPYQILGTFFFKPSRDVLHIYICRSIWNASVPAWNASQSLSPIPFSFSRIINLFIVASPYRQNAILPQIFSVPWIAGAIIQDNHFLFTPSPVPKVKMGRYVSPDGFYICLLNIGNQSWSNGSTHCVRFHIMITHNKPASYFSSSACLRNKDEERYRIYRSGKVVSCPHHRLSSKIRFSYSRRSSGQKVKEWFAPSFAFSIPGRL